jgi:hypothetical protein
MIALVSPCMHNCYKRFKGAHEEDRRAMGGSPVVQALPKKGGDGKRDRDPGAGQFAPD